MDLKTDIKMKRGQRYNQLLWMFSMTSFKVFETCSPLVKSGITFKNKGLINDVLVINKLYKLWNSISYLIGCIVTF